MRVTRGEKLRLRARSWREASGLVMAAALLVAGGVTTAGSASAMPVPENGKPGELALDAEPFPLGMHELAPGGVVRWQITASIDQASGSTLDLRIVGHGVMALDPAGITLEIDWCPRSWSVPSDTTLPASCPGGGQTALIAATPIATIPAGDRPIGHLDEGTPSHMLVTAELPLSAGSRFVNDTGGVDLVFQAAGDTETVQIGSPGRLVTTGSAIAGPAMLAAGLLLAGLTLASIRNRRVTAATGTTPVRS